MFSQREKILSQSNCTISEIQLVLENGGFWDQGKNRNLRNPPFVRLINSTKISIWDYRELKNPLFLGFSAIKDAIYWVSITNRFQIYQTLGFPINY